MTAQRSNPFRGVAINQGVCDGIDRGEAAKALTLLVDPANKVELRPLPSARSVILPGSDLAGLLEAADEAERDGNTVYMVLNPVDPPAGARACRDAFAAARRWIFFDVDPVRAEGFDKSCSTEQEKAAAGELAARLTFHLSERGFPLPVQIDSGNGYYLYYRSDLPNDEVAKALVKRLVKRLKEELDTDAAVIDPTVTNAARLAKLPGTLNRKGADTPERPHRRCRLMYVPEAIESVPLEAIQRVAGTAAAEHARQPGSVFQGRVWTGTSAAYGKKALAEETGKVLLAMPGAAEGRNNALNKAAFSLGQLVAGGVLSRGEVESALLAAALAAGLPKQEAERTLLSGIEAGAKEPRGVPGHAPAPSTNGTHEQKKPDAPAAYRASTVKPRKVEWLWPYRIPLGKLTTFAGIMGIGKTFLLCDLAARVSAGLPWPDAPDDANEPGDVLFISGEDDPDDTLVPRLIECNADLDRVWFLNLDELVKFTLRSLDVLDRAAAQMKRLKFMVIDPPTSYLGDVDDHKNAELRQLLTPLKHWTAERRCASAFNTHLNKGGGQKVEAIFRVIGSVAWMAAVRAGHLIAEDPDDRERRLFVPMKSNLGRKAQALAYTIEQTEGDLAKVVWLGGVDVTADQAVNREKRKPKRHVLAAIWLAELFSGGVDELPSKEIFEKQKETTISDDALREAKDEMGIKAVQRYPPEPGLKRAWWWYWPAAARQEWERRGNPFASGAPEQRED